MGPTTLLEGRWIDLFGTSSRAQQGTAWHKLMGTVVAISSHTLLATSRLHWHVGYTSKPLPAGEDSEQPPEHPTATSSCVHDDAVLASYSMPVTATSTSISPAALCGPSRPTQIPEEVHQCSTLHVTGRLGSGGVSCRCPSHMQPHTHVPVHLQLVHTNPALQSCSL